MRWGTDHTLNKELLKVISSADGTKWIKGGGGVPGLNRDKNSYRGELAPLIGIATCLVVLGRRMLINNPYPVIMTKL